MGDAPLPFIAPASRELRGPDPSEPAPLANGVLLFAELFGYLLRGVPVPHSALLGQGGQGGQLGFDPSETLFQPAEPVREGLHGKRVVHGHTCDFQIIATALPINEEPSADGTI